MIRQFCFAKKREHHLYSSQVEVHAVPKYNGIQSRPVFSCFASRVNRRRT